MEQGLSLSARLEEWPFQQYMATLMGEPQREQTSPHRQLPVTPISGTAVVISRCLSPLVYLYLFPFQAVCFYFLFFVP